MTRQKKILLVDDDSKTRDALARALVEADYRVVAALNGSDALRQIQQHSIDVAVLGLGRDSENDWDTVERLTQNQPQLRFIVAGTDSEGFAHPLASTAEALLEKPIDLPLLFETLEGLSEFSYTRATRDLAVCTQNGAHQNSSLVLKTLPVSRASRPVPESDRSEPEIRNGRIPDGSQNGARQD